MTRSHQPGQTVTLNSVFLNRNKSPDIDQQPNDCLARMSGGESIRSRTYDVVHALARRASQPVRSPVAFNEFVFIRRFERFAAVLLLRLLLSPNSNSGSSNDRVDDNSTVKAHWKSRAREIDNDDATPFNRACVVSARLPVTAVAAQPPARTRIVTQFRRTRRS